MAEKRRPLILRAPLGVLSLYNCTSVLVSRLTACTLDQSGMCLATQPGKATSSSKGTSPAAVAFLNLSVWFRVRFLMASSD